MKQSDNGKELDDIVFPLQLSLLKPFHAQWFVELYNQMGTKEGADIIHIAWKASCISDALKAGKFSLQSLNPFHDICSVVKLD